MTTTPGGKGKGPRNATRGSILVPCLFMLSLLSLLTLGMLDSSGIGNSSSASLAKRTQAQFGALSGIEIAYMRLGIDPDYVGEECTPFRNSSFSIDIDVTALGDSEYEVISHGDAGGSENRIRTRAGTSPFALYPLTVGENVYLKGNSTIIGDCYAKNILYGKDKSGITSNVYLYGTRSITYSAEGAPLTIDGLPSPQIGGEVYTEVPFLDFPEVASLDSFRAQAAAAGQLFTSATHLTAVDLTGVVYFEGYSSKVFFNDVTIRGLLVCDGVAEIRVDGGFLKIHCDDTIAPNVAILAPDSFLWVDPNGLADIYGLTLVHSADFQGSGTFTGPFVVLHDLVALPNSYLYCQIPSDLKQLINTESLWNEVKLVEMEFELQ
jgi:hypothetical protein